MFLAYQPHLYERERRIEKSGADHSPSKVSSSSTASSSPSTLRKYSFTSDVAVFPPIRRSDDSHSSSVYRNTAADSSSSKGKARKTKMTSTNGEQAVGVGHGNPSGIASSSSSTSNSTGNGAAGLFSRWLPINRGKSTGRTRKISGPTDDLQWDDDAKPKPFLQGLLHGHDTHRSTSSPREAQVSGFFPSSWDPQERKGEYMRARRISRDSFKLFSPSSRSPSLQSSSKPPPTAMQAVAAAGSHDKPEKLKRPRKPKARSDRPTTANAALQTIGKAEKERHGFFANPHATKSEHDLTDSTRAGVESHAGPNEEQQEILITDVPAFSIRRKSRQQNDLRITISGQDDGEDEQQRDPSDLSRYPLPVRLGLISPDVVDIRLTNDINSPSSSDSSSSDQHFARKGTTNFSDFFSDIPSRTPKCLHRAQYIDGYYLITPPPQKRTRKLSHSLSPLSPLLPFHSPASSPRPSLSTSTSAHGISASVAHRQGTPRTKPSRRPRTSESVSSRSNSPTKTKWKLDEYFDVQRIHRPGHFGFKERKAHAFAQEQAPYPWGYGPDSIMADALMHSAVEKTLGLTNASAGGSTGHTPRRVLDIGCGVGHWIVDMAKRWPETEFIGLDLVPIQKTLSSIEDGKPDAERSPDGNVTVGSSADLQRRVSWVVANALDGLPFPEQSFDFVHIRFINEGVPKRKWQTLLAEAIRVLTPGGQLELMELDFSFFGSPMQIHAKDLMDLINGKYATGSPQERDPYKPIHSKSRDEVYAARRNGSLSTILRQTLINREIGLDPALMLPSYLCSLVDALPASLYSDTRQVPVLARSHQQSCTSLQPLLSSSTNGHLDHQEANSGDDGDQTVTAVWTVHSSETNGDIRAGLNYVEGTDASGADAHGNHSSAKLRLEHLDVLRMAIMQASLLRLTDNRHVFWQEIESVRNRDELERTPKMSDRDSSFKPQDLHRSKSSHANVTKDAISTATAPSAHADKTKIDLDACLKRWPDFASFERDIDLWESDMQNRTEIDSLLRHRMHWGEAALRIDGWQESERLRKILQRQPDGQDRLPGLFSPGQRDQIAGHKAHSKYDGDIATSPRAPKQRKDDVLSGRQKEHFEDKEGLWTEDTLFSSFPSVRHGTTEILGLGTISSHVISKKRPDEVDRQSPMAV